MKQKVGISSNIVFPNRDNRKGNARHDKLTPPRLHNKSTGGLVVTYL